MERGTIPRAEIEVRLAFTIKRGDRLHDILELLIAQFRKDRKGQDFLSRSLRLREGTLRVPQVAVAVLQVQRQRIIHFRTHALLFQITA